MGIDRCYGSAAWLATRLSQAYPNKTPVHNGRKRECKIKAYSLWDEPKNSRSTCERSSPCGTAPSVCSTGPLESHHYPIPSSLHSFLFDERSFSDLRNFGSQTVIARNGHSFGAQNHIRANTTVLPGVVLIPIPYGQFFGADCLVTPSSIWYLSQYRRENENKHPNLALVSTFASQQKRNPCEIAHGYVPLYAKSEFQLNSPTTPKQTNVNDAPIFIFIPSSSIATPIVGHCSFRW